MNAKFAKWSLFLKLFFVAYFAAFAVCAEPADVQIEKQKLKLSLEYENFIDEVGNEVRTPGIKTTYLLKLGSTPAKKLNWSLDLQSGLKSNLDTTFSVGTLSRFIWSNRVNLQGNVPIGKFYVGGGFYFRNKWFSDVPPEEQFVDLFGGIGFHEVVGTMQGGVALTPSWDLSGSVQLGEFIYERYPLSNSDWNGGSVRLTRKFERFRGYTFYRQRNVDYSRPIFSEPSAEFPFVPVPTGDLQHDRFREAGIGFEIAHPFYFSGMYSYQVNSSNNPGFSYHNNQIGLLVGTQLASNWYAQAYGIVQRFDFLDEEGFLPFPLLVGENDENNLAVSLVRTFSGSSEIELGLQHLTNNSSFSQLKASKTVLYAAYNYRF